ncbi:MAG TPA: helix-hairpin-helix domain-containing protein [Deltaproteobacteria bacterium]|nr:helix-hairpin-helix domain-containing protein [Deltaproteobacteria bacterium]HPJ93571.1 helix-hairpin-helix domain-containing protein [Deltaproteobacteria bacterium]HPR50489.1 helix-hairpin-helix domain-containing protein [Deltaproteobacteria bacterium]
MKKLSMLTLGIVVVMFTLGGIAYGGHGQVNINTASADELQWLPGISEAIAENIIEFRQVNGAFTSLDELVKVEGMSEGKLRNITNSLKREGVSGCRADDVAPETGHAPGRTQ